MNAVYHISCFRFFFKSKVDKIVGRPIKAETGDNILHTTKSLHLEVATDLSTVAFIGCLKRSAEEVDRKKMTATMRQTLCHKGPLGGNNEILYRALN